MKFIPLVGIVLIAASCSSNLEKEVIDKSRNEPPVERERTESVEEYDMSNDLDLEERSATKSNKVPEWTYEIVPISEGNWGYQLFQNGKMVINQTTIPSVQGNNGFATAEKAERTAEYILKKLEDGIFPPTVDRKELEELDVLRD